ncbi:SDR family oxidoreductase [Flexibacterium corallicola]|uniref:SDR family oxidoreductase n=1 Tax=Flexibacterium corallicola TaxID=3037259 RepID=UPI00286F402D|nr:SDR family oxidoreductase [Pseudovibrio sp. M1P-2-3]
MNRSCLIIGASSLIARQIMQELDCQSMQFIAHAHSNVEALHKDNGLENSEVVPLQADLASPEGAYSLISQASAICGVPDAIIFAQAPPLRLTRFKSLKLEQVQEHLQVQLLSSVEIARAFLPAMARRGSGRVVFIISSVTLGLPPAAMADYTIAKYAQLGLVRSLASEYGPKGLRINAVSPSMVDTPYLNALPDNMVTQNAAGHPLGRNALPQEIAPVVRLLLSSQATYMNGVNIPITGGVCV